MDTTAHGRTIFRTNILHIVRLRIRLRNKLKIKIVCTIHTCENLLINSIFLIADTASKNLIYSPCSLNFQVHFLIFFFLQVGGNYLPNSYSTPVCYFDANSLTLAKQFLIPFTSCEFITILNYLPK